MDITCPAGHRGPFLFVEAIEVMRRVLEVRDDGLVVEAAWRTDEVGNEGMPGTQYLLCDADDGVGRCVQQFAAPPVARWWVR